MAMHAYYVSEWERAIEYYGRAEDLARRCGEVIGTGIAALNHGELRLDQGRLEEAHELLESALRTLPRREVPDRRGRRRSSISAISQRSRGASRTRPSCSTRLSSG